MSMSTNEALNLCKRLKNHYRAFEKIDELLKEASAARIFLKESLGQRESIEQEIVALAQKRDEASESCISMTREKEEAQRNLEEVTEKLARIKGEIAQIRERLERGKI
ncbi:unnamed protein product [marine sediment metagenome]|uniref:Uncharacterized protein n=1 Tax=marine sediment metagenome TaxID=412755 RepID=X1FN37_9ZZZZ